MEDKRFIPYKVDNKRWGVYDTHRKQPSTYLCHGYYKTKQLCQIAIDYANTEYEQYLK